jgi:hypothetical protein
MDRKSESVLHLLCRTHRCGDSSFGRLNSSGSLAKFTAIPRASSWVSSFIVRGRQSLVCPELQKLNFAALRRGRFLLSYSPAASCSFRSASSGKFAVICSPVHS